MEYDIPMKPYGPTAGRDHIEDKPRPKTKTKSRRKSFLIIKRVTYEIENNRRRLSYA